jgi:hypothetical protein
LRCISLLRHAELFRMPHTWMVRVLVPRRFWKAAALYKAALLWTPLEPHITDRLEAYLANEQRVPELPLGGEARILGRHAQRRGRVEFCAAIGETHAP